MKTLLAITFLSAFSLFLPGCHKSDTAATHINCDGLVTDTLGTGDNARIYMPNAFTPNGDGLNDTIKPISLNTSSLTFTIYDGNNNLVYIAAWPFEGWSPAITANTFETYYYKIVARTYSNHLIGICGELYKLSCRPNNAPTLYFPDQLTPNGFTDPTSESLPVCP